MPESAPATAAAEDTALSFDDGAAELAKLLSGPDDSAPENEDEAPVDADGGQEPGPDDTDAPVDADAQPEEQDGPGYSGGKFASDDAKVTMKDGSILSITDLKRGYLAQRDYYRQTDETRSLKESLQAEKAQHGEIAQALSQQREFLLSVAKQILPQPPDKAMLETDPIGYMQAKSAYEEQVGILNQVYHQQQLEKGRSHEETEAERAETVRAEAQKLFERAPELRKREVYQQFWTDATDIMQSKYGISAAEIEASPDHRFYLAMKDLVRFHKALAKASTVKAEVKAKPKIMTGGARMAPGAKTSRDAQQRTEQLRKSGSFDAGVAALMDLNL